MPGAPVGRWRDCRLAGPAARSPRDEQAQLAWDREHFVSKLPSKLDAILKRRG
jgi:hypothetical protein